MNQEASYPRAVIHFDGDSFFASVEQAKDWRLRGRPVVTGGERGAATSLSKEAKALGLHRGMPMQEIRRVCPQVVIVAGDYTAYSIYARRMYAIVRKYTPLVDEYSIDECFADITGRAEEQGTTYEAIALAIKTELQTSLGVTFGVGLSTTKTLAKLASKHEKPDSLTCIPLEKRDEYLACTDVSDVWGLGGVSGVKLRRLGVMTALDLVKKDGAWLQENGFVAPQRATWLELRGSVVLGFIEHYTKPHSVMVTRTFTPPSTDRAYIFAQLSKNVEGACAKSRRAGMKASALSFYLKTQEFTYHGVQIDLPAATDTPFLIIEEITKRFEEVYAEGILYRASGVTLRALTSEASLTPDLFGVYDRVSARDSALVALDDVNKKYGRNTVYLGSSMQAFTTPETGYRKSMRRSFLHSGPSRKKSLDIPFLGTVH